jgi:hypothetical protein
MNFGEYFFLTLIESFDVFQTRQNEPMDKGLWAHDDGKHYYWDHDTPDTSELNIDAIVEWSK